MDSAFLGTNVKVNKITYDKSSHTFLVEIVDFLGLPLLKKFDNINFPQMKPFKILDENVLVGEKVMFWLKNVDELKKEGWTEDTKKHLVKDNAVFKIGKNKKILLDNVVNGQVGITEKMTPYVYDPKTGFRFSENELKLIIKTTPPQLSFIDNTLGFYDKSRDLYNIYTGVKNISINSSELDQILKFFKLSGIV